MSSSMMELFHAGTESFYSSLRSRGARAPKQPDMTEKRTKKAAKVSLETRSAITVR